MPRTRADGTRRAKQTVKITYKFVSTVKPEAERVTYYDTDLKGFALRVEPSGRMAFKFTYRHGKRPRWFHLGDVREYLWDEGVDAVRVRVQELLLRRMRDRSFDPQAHKVAQRSDSTFAQDLDDYLEHCAAQKSVDQKRRAITSVFYSAWENKPTNTIIRADVRHVLEKSGITPISQEFSRRHLSAFFAWALKNDRYTEVNPCANLDIENSGTTRGERTVTLDEMPSFWKALGTLKPDVARVLKLILLTGARGAEVLGMKHEQVERVTIKLPPKMLGRLRAEGQLAPETVTGFVWTQPAGSTKNKREHSVWLTREAHELVGEGEGPVFKKRWNLPLAMGRVCKKMGLAGDNRITPHDLRRTFSDTVTWAGFDDYAMHRMLNHQEGFLTETYSPSQRLPEAWEIATTVVKELLSRTVERGHGVGDELTG